MTDAKELVTMLRDRGTFVMQGPASILAAGRLAADLIEQQAARIAELEAHKGAEPVAWRHNQMKVLRHDAIAKGADFDPVDWTPLYLAAPVASGPRYDWSFSGMKKSETGNWVMAGEGDKA